MFNNYMAWLPRLQEQGKLPLSRDLLTIAVCGWFVAWVRSFNVTGDHAITNILTLIAAFVALMALVIWFLFVSRYALSLKRGFVVAAGLLLATLAILYRIEKVSGELIPEFVYRFGEKKANPPPAPEALSEGLMVLRSDYPGFLGAARQAWLDWPGIRLARDWNKNPPRELWRAKVGQGWSGFAVQNGFAITLEQHGEQETVNCYDAFTGKIQWSFAYPALHNTVLGYKGPRSTPTIHNGKVYTLGATGMLHCLSGATGKPLWSKNLLDLLGVTQIEDEQGVAWGRSGSPLMVDHMVVIPGGKKKSGECVSLFAFDAETGEMAWQAGESQISYSSPTLIRLCGVRQIVVVNEALLSGHDPSTGQLLWSEIWKGTSSGDANTSQPVLLEGDRLLLSKGYGQGGAVFQFARSDASWTIEPVWENKKVLLTKFTNVAVYGAYGYGLCDGELQCVNLQTGQSMWRLRAGPYRQGQLLRVNDVLIVQAEDGHVHLVEATPTEHRPLAKLAAIEGQTWNNPAIFPQRNPSGGWQVFLLTRNSQEAACYELPLENP